MHGLQYFVSPLCLFGEIFLNPSEQEFLGNRIVAICASTFFQVPIGVVWQPLGKFIIVDQLFDVVLKLLRLRVMCRHPIWSANARIHLSN